MSERRLLRMTAPVRDPFEIPYHDVGDPGAPPRIAFVGGIHGNELNGVYVLAHLARFLRAVAEGERPPLRLTGRVVVVPAVNVLGVNLRKRAWPFDGTDVNRMFPGYDAGETTQRIAHAVMEATRAASIRVDVHSSNLDFEELPQVRLYDPSPGERSTARLFGLPAVVERPSSSVFTATLGHAWRGLGGESFVVQAGRAGDLQLEHTDRLFGAFVRFCARVGVLQGTRLSDEDHEVWHFGPRQTLPLVSDQAGFFVSKVDIGAWLRAGDHVGFVYDPFDGELRAEVKAPRPGSSPGFAASRSSARATWSPACRPATSSRRAAPTPTSTATASDGLRAAGAGAAQGLGRSGVGPPARARFPDAAVRHAPCFCGMAQDSGERRLMIAVLEDAIRTLLLAKRAAVPLKRLRHDLSWIESTAQDEPFAFESICDALGFDSGYLRRRLLEGGFQAPMRRRTLRRSLIASPRPCSRSY